MPIFDSIERLPISHTPTPLEAMPRLSKAMGCNLYIKRDDCTGLGGGGNKARKLEYLLAEAKAFGADTLVTIGGLQSNHARQTAAAAAKFGLGCELILKDVPGTPTKDYYHSGNILLDKLFGATIHPIDKETKAGIYKRDLIAKLKDQGKTPYFIDLGGSSVTGSLGYVHCANEIIAQTRDKTIHNTIHNTIHLDQIVVATGSGGTQAGLLAGLVAARVDIPVLGICVLNNAQTQSNIVQKLLTGTLQRMGLNLQKNPQNGDNRVLTDDNYLGEGYGIPTPNTIAAVKQCAELEGILLDPVYTGKAMAGLIDYCQTGRFEAHQNVLFIHTGGSPGLFAYSDAFE